MRNYRNYEPGDIELVNARPEVLNPSLLSDWQLENTDLRTFIINGEVAAVCGHTMIWPGLGEAWLHTSDLIIGHGPMLVRGCKKLLEDSQRKYGVRRTNALIHIKRPEYLKWCEALGFVGESVMKRAAPDGSDLILMVKWRVD